MACIECDAIRGAKSPMVRRGGLVIHGKLVPPPIPGWILIAPAAHLERLEDLAPEDIAALGPLIVEISRLLRAATPTEKIYVSLFAEKLPHIHVHVIPRPPGLSTTGPAIFDLPGTIEDDSVVRAVLGKLALPVD